MSECKRSSMASAMMLVIAAACAGGIRPTKAVVDAAAGTPAAPAN